MAAKFSGSTLFLGSSGGGQAVVEEKKGVECMILTSHRSAHQD